MSLPSPITSSIPNRNLSANDPNNLQQQQTQQLLDAPLIALTQRCNGDLRVVLHSFFSFLHRRTDFYYVHNPQDVQEGNHVNIGFREGDAEKLLLAAFRQFPLRRMPPVSQLKNGPPPPTSTTSSSNSTMKDESNDKDVKNELNQDLGKSDAGVRNGSQTKNNKEKDRGEKDEIRYTSEGHQVPIGNGGSTKHYKWTQTLQEVTIAMPLPTSPDVRAKDLHVEMKPCHVHVQIKSTDKMLLEGELVERIRPDECTWSIESNVMLITLDKMEKKWWDRIFKEEVEKIDLALVDKTHKISDYDEATQGMIRRILFDQRQERLGLAKSDALLSKTEKQKNKKEDTGLGALKDCHGNSVEADSLPAGVEFIDKHNFPGNNT